MCSISEVSLNGTSCCLFFVVPSVCSVSFFVLPSFRGSKGFNYPVSFPLLLFLTINVMVLVELFYTLFGIFSAHTL